MSPQNVENLTLTPLEVSRGGSVHLKSATIKARRYVDIFTLVSKVYVFQSESSMSSFSVFTGMFHKTTGYIFSAVISIEKLALKLGSSKQGITLRAAKGSICEANTFLGGGGRHVRSGIN